MDVGSDLSTRLQEAHPKQHRHIHRHRHRHIHRHRHTHTMSTMLRKPRHVSTMHVRHRHRHRHRHIHRHRHTHTHHVNNAKKTKTCVNDACQPG